ncbi:MAG: ABC transporter permease subunit [Phycisphaeraceae bacterium]|nr:ABC transporter permease subunit [Phycisphaerales bacterium]MCB9860344.1 ABC transporter permease subunit [Phycisphaeraceae bacterium]
MPGQLLTIARNCFLESIRQPIYFLIVMISGVCQLLLTWGTNFSMGKSTETGEVNYDNKLLLDLGLGTIFVCGTVLAAFVATAVISEEIERKTVLTVVSKPVSRPTLVIGKYLGVSLSLLVGMITMAIFMLMGIRHGVMSTAADKLDWVVITFSIGTVFLCLVLSAAANYLYSWSFSQAAVLSLAPAMIISYLFVLVLSPKWEWQAISTDFKPQISMACAALTLAVLMLSAVAVAASTRLGQVMTIVVTGGVFLGGLLSNYFIGSKAWTNSYVGRVLNVTPEHPAFEKFTSLGDTLIIELENPPTALLSPGTPVYWGATPNGMNLQTSHYKPLDGDFATISNLNAPEIAPAIAVVSSEGKKANIQQIGRAPVKVNRPPREGDYLFVKPTRLNIAAAGVWSILPNLHFYWLLDAITQNSYIPIGHLWLIAVYAVLQICGVLCIAIALFQTRDVG